MNTTLKKSAVPKFGTSPFYLAVLHDPLTA